MKTKKKKGTSTTVILVVVLIAGLSLLLYPGISDYWNSFHSSVAIADYSESVAQISEEEYDKYLADARSYNSMLASRENSFHLDEQMKQQYNKLLDITGTGIMGYIEIPSIKVSIPVYHGTSEATLQVAIGHLEWSSLPVGGENTHCVVSGHRGLPSARLFTDLDKLAVGDVFMLSVLNDIYTYEVDQILIVEPQEMDSLEIIENGDYCTLVTCTPYGINSHRLLVRGHRIENAEVESVARVTADAMQIEPMIIAPIVAIPILLLLLIGVLFRPSKKKNKKSSDVSEQIK